MDNQKLEELKAKGKIANQWANNAAEGIMRQMNITRMRLNISAPDFAEIIGMPSKHSLYSVYNREGRTVHLKQFLAFCRVFGYDIETTTNRSAAEEEIDSAVFESVGALSALSGKALHKIAAFVTDLEGVDTYDKRRVSMCLHALANATSAEDEKQEICTPEKTWEDIQKNAKDKEQVWDACIYAVDEHYLGKERAEKIRSDREKYLAAVEKQRKEYREAGNESRLIDNAIPFTPKND